MDIILNFLTSIFGDFSDYLKAIFEIAKDTDNLTPDGIMSFFGTLLGTLVAGLIAVWISKRQSKKDIERERTIISEKLKIDMYLEVNELLKDYENEVYLLYKLFLHYKALNKAHQYSEASYIGDILFPKTEKDIHPLIRKTKLRIGLLPEIKEKYEYVDEKYRLLVYIIETKLSGISSDEKLDDIFKETYGEDADGIDSCYEDYNNSIENISNDISNQLKQVLNVPANKKWRWSKS